MSTGVVIEMYFGNPSVWNQVFVGLNALVLVLWVSVLWRELVAYGRKRDAAKSAFKSGMR